MAAEKVYFTPFEKKLILELSKPFLAVIENKETNGVCWSKKAEAFEDITRLFNATPNINLRRTTKQIRQCYLNLKKKEKHKAAKLRQEGRSTGDEQSDTTLTEIECVIVDKAITLPLGATVLDSELGIADIDTTAEDVEDSIVDLPRSIQDQDDQSQPGPSSPPPPPPTKKKKKVNNTTVGEENALENFLLNKIIREEAPSDAKLTADDCFGSYVTETLKSFKNVKHKEQCKAAISSVLVEYMFKEE